MPRPKVKLKFFPEHYVLDDCFTQKQLADEGYPSTQLSHPILYRGDSRRPEDIFVEGFERRIETATIIKASISNEHASLHCISCSKEIIHAIGFADRPNSSLDERGKRAEYGWVYMVYAEKGIDLTIDSFQTLKNSLNSAKYVEEVALTRVKPEYILAALKIKTTPNHIGAYMKGHSDLIKHPQILVTELQINPNCIISLQQPELYMASIDMLKEIANKGYVRIPWAPGEEEIDFVATHSLNEAQKQVYRMGYSYEEAIKIESSLQVDGLKKGFSLTEVYEKDFSHHHLRAIALGHDIELIRTCSRIEAYGILQGLKSQDLKGLKYYYEVDAISVGFTYEDIHSDWFCKDYIVTIHNGVDIEALRGKKVLVNIDTAIRTNNLSAIEYLLENGLQLANLDKNLLSNAVINNQIELVRLFLKHKACPNSIYKSAYQRGFHSHNPNNYQPKYEGLSPLYIATLNNNIELVHLLLEYQANPNFQERETRSSPLFVALVNGYDEIANLLQRYEAKEEEALFCGSIKNLIFILPDKERLNRLKSVIEKNTKKYDIFSLTATEVCSVYKDMEINKSNSFN